MEIENSNNKLLVEDNSDCNSDSESDEQSPTAATFLENLKGLSSKFECQNKTSKPIRLLYPRIGWHDVHCKVVGIPARDIASHFVQVIEKYIYLLFFSKFIS